jgi:hypothetical protein
MNVLRSMPTYFPRPTNCTYQLSQEVNAVEKQQDKSTDRTFAQQASVRSLIVSTLCYAHVLVPISHLIYTHPIPSTPTQCTHRLPCKHAPNPANVIYRMQERECQPTDTLAVRRMEMLSMLNKCPPNNEAWGIYGPNRNSLVAKRKPRVFGCT